MEMTLIHVQRYRHQDLKPENILTTNMDLPTSTLSARLGSSIWPSLWHTIPPPRSTAPPDLYEAEEQTQAVDAYSFATLSFFFDLGGTPGEQPCDRHSYQAASIDGRDNRADTTREAVVEPMILPG
jgi:serine/threonine protein kinase